MVASGIRIAELLGLDLGVVDFGNATAKVLRKGRKERIVPVGRTALQHLEGYIKELLGHESLDTLKHYAKLTIIDLKKEHQRCHPKEREDRGGEWGGEGY